MKAFSILALAALVVAAVQTMTPSAADARIYCPRHHTCMEGKYASKPLAGMTCRSLIRKRPGYRTHFFCTAA